MGHNFKASQSQSGAPTTITPEYIGQVYVDESSSAVYVADGVTQGDWVSIGVGTLDESYGAGTATVTVDAYDVAWNLTGAYSFEVDLSSITGGADGFFVEGGADYFRLTYAAADTVNLTAAINTGTIDAGSTMQVTAGATSDLTLGGRGSTITLNESGDTALSGFTATSIVGALNEVKTDIGSYTLDDAYNASGGASTVAVDAGDVTWTVTGANDFKVDISGANSDKGFLIDGGDSDYFRLGFAGASMYLEADVESYSMSTAGSYAVTATTTVQIQGSGQVDITANGAAVDMQFTARSSAITLNESGEESLDVGFTATSIVGALNELYGSSSAPTLDDAYNNFSGAGSVTIDAGDLTWALSGAYSMVVDLSSASGAADGFFVNDGADYFRLTHAAADTVNLAAAINTGTIDAGSTMQVTAGASSDLTLGGRGATITLNESGQTSLSGFTATSLIGALNELKTGGVEIPMKEYDQTTEPTLAADGNMAVWRNDSEQIFLVYRRGTGDQVAVELA